MRLERTSGNPVACTKRMKMVNEEAGVRDDEVGLVIATIRSPAHRSGGPGDVLIEQMMMQVMSDDAHA